MGGGSLNPLINYVMEKWLSLLHVWGDWNVAVCEQLFLMRWAGWQTCKCLKNAKPDLYFRPFLLEKKGVWARDEDSRRAG